MREGPTRVYAHPRHTSAPPCCSSTQTRPRFSSLPQQLKEFEEKIDLEDERAAARDQLDLKSLGGDSDDELEEKKRGAAMDLPQPPLMEWDLLKVGQVRICFRPPTPFRQT